MKAKISLEKKGRKRNLILSGNQLLIVFHDNYEADNAYAHLKSEMKKDGWLPLTLKQFISDVKDKGIKKSKVMHLPLKNRTNND